MNWLLSRFFLIPSWLLSKKNLAFFFIDKDQTWGGNLRAFFEFIYNRGEIELVIVNNGLVDSSVVRALYPDVQIVEKITFKILIKALRAKYFIITHGKKPLRGILSGVKGYKLINLWHGIPIKTMGNLQASNEGRVNKYINIYESAKSFDLMCCSSLTDKAMMSACLMIHGDRLFVSGIPKTDWLLCSENKLPHDYLNDVSKLEYLLKGRSLVFYSPTGRDNNSMNCFFDDDVLQNLVDVLSENNCIMGFRYHGLRLQNRFREIHRRLIDQGVIIDLGIDQFPESNIILRKTHVLVCDYSSIFIDYLLTNKPIIKFAYDLDDYLKNRGLLYNYEKVLPGKLVLETNMLSSAILETVRKYEVKEYPEKWLFYQYEDDRACERLYHRMIKLI